MSAAKRSRQRPADASPQPEAKRVKITKSNGVPAKSGLEFLVDEDARAGKKLEARLVNAKVNPKASRVNESRAIVATADVQEKNSSALVEKVPDVIEVSSNDDSSSVDDDGDDDDADLDEAPTGVNRQGAALLNGHVSEADEEEDDVEVDLSNARIKTLPANHKLDAEIDGVADEPTFGDLLKARHPQPIDIGDNAPSHALVPAPGDRGLAPPSSTSLSTVLTQALKTNDKELLESCFRLNDLPSIRSTIQRLPSQHVATLLQRIAERIHRRPGRTGSLMVWIQWSLVAHGAFLANQPEVMRKIKSLTHIIRERASGLQPLLHLKGKLDLLSAQLELRRSLNDAAGPTDDEDDEDAALYIEGEDDDAFSGSDGIEEAETEYERIRQQAKSGAASTLQLTNGLTNGVDGDSSEEEDDDDEANDNDDTHDLVDIEAEEESEGDSEGENSDEEGGSSGDESEAEDNFSEDEDDDEDDDAQSEIIVSTPRLSTLNRKR